VPLLADKCWFSFIRMVSLETGRSAAAAVTISVGYVQRIVFHCSAFEIGTVNILLKTLLEHFSSMCAVDTKLVITTVKKYTLNCFRRLAHPTKSMLSSCRRSAYDIEVFFFRYFSVRRLLIIICTLSINRPHTKKNLSGSGMANEEAKVPLLFILTPRNTH